MKDKSKIILGLELKKRKSVAIRSYSLEEKHFIIGQWLSSGLSKREIWEKYTGHVSEHGQLLRWMRRLGYELVNHGQVCDRKTSLTMKQKASSEPEITSFEYLQLQNRVAELEAQLKTAEMKAIAMSTMVDIAEKG